MAVVAARVRRAWAAGRPLVAVGLAIAAVVGLSRIYLRAHYWSDVAAGWGLGAAVLGACAVATLIVAHFRNNQPPRR